MKINVCTIDRNYEEGRQLIYWDTEDKLLHSELEPEDENGYPCETLEAAGDMAWTLWGNGWDFAWVEYSIRPEYIDEWCSDDGPYEGVTLNARDIGTICRGWGVPAESVMDQLTEEVG